MARRINREFETWGEFIACVSDPKLARWAESNRHSQSERKKFTGTKTFAEAIDLAVRTGWRKGRDLMADAMALAAPRPEPYRSIAYEVAGMVPMVPLAIAGDPASMMEFGDSAISARPVVRIDYTHSCHFGIEAGNITNRGAAVLSICDSLERRGYSVELRIIGGASAGGMHFQYAVNYKRAGELLDLDRAAFALAHPSVLRRFYFALIEQHAECENAYSGNYGSPMQVRYDDNPATIWISGPCEGDRNPALAREAVEGEVAAQMPGYSEAA